jgi:hypothetical protein
MPGKHGCRGRGRWRVVHRLDRCRRRRHGLRRQALARMPAAIVCREMHPGIKALGAVRAVGRSRGSSVAIAVGRRGGHMYLNESGISQQKIKGGRPRRKTILSYTHLRPTPPDAAMDSNTSIDLRCCLASFLSCSFSRAAFSPAARHSLSAASAAAVAAAPSACTARWCSCACSRYSTVICDSRNSFTKSCGGGGVLGFFCGLRFVGCGLRVAVEATHCQWIEYSGRFKNF